MNMPGSDHFDGGCCAPVCVVVLLMHANAARDHDLPLFFSFSRSDWIGLVGLD